MLGKDSGGFFKFGGVWHGRSLCGENAGNAGLKSVIHLDRRNRTNAKVNRLFGGRPVHIVAAQITD
jgi:hypothetical protein